MREIETDFVIVGSGAGAGPVAFYLARAGERVVVLERGHWVHPEDMSDDELSMLALLFKDGGAQMNVSVDMTLLQGNCVGGSTVLTNAVCFRLPEDVRQTYANLGFDLPLDELEASYQRVEAVINAHEVEEENQNAAGFKLEHGMRAMGIEPQRFKKATLDCFGCGYCNLGCRYGRKMDSSRTWIPMAQDRGATILTRTEAYRLETDGDQVTALLANDLDSGERVRIRAKRYVLSGGAINTPELLLRSKVLRDRVGRRTSMNAGAMMMAEYPEPLDAFDGDQMCTYHMEDRYTIEHDHNPFLSFCMTMPGWLDSYRDEKPDMYRHITAAGVLTPTQSTARVFMNPLRRLLPKLFDSVEISFRLPEEDRLTMIRGYKQLAEIYFASGASRVLVPTHKRTEIRGPDEIGILDHALRDSRLIAGLGSAHPQGGCNIGDDDKRDVLTPEFRVRGMQNLFVSDASVFPASMGVNPMASIMAIGDRATRFIGGFVPEPAEEGRAWEARQQRERAEPSVAPAAETVR